MPQIQQSSKDKFRSSFPEVAIPEDDLPKMPLRISALSTVSLGDLLSRYSAWREYADDMANTATADYLIEAEKYNHERAKKSIMIDGKLGEKKLALDADEGLFALYGKLLEKQTYSEMLSKKVANLSDCISTISREISRRGQMIERG